MGGGAAGVGEGGGGSGDGGGGEGGSVGSGGGLGEVASEQKSAKRERMAARSLPMYACVLMGVEAIDSSVCCDAPPMPTAKMVAPAPLSRAADWMGSLSPLLLTPSEMTHTTACVELTWRPEV